MPDIFAATRSWLEDAGYHIVSEDLTRPWGGFYVMDTAQLAAFIEQFFPTLGLTPTAASMSPKILMVAPGQRLSWQYHHRRREHWSVVTGPAGMMRSLTDEPGDLITLDQGQVISLQTGERHRLIGLESWGVVAEIWEHVDPTQVSDEDDIVRVDDDYQRAA